MHLNKLKEERALFYIQLQSYIHPCLTNEVPFSQLRLIEG
jgi:hypothetical protein